MKSGRKNAISANMQWETSEYLRFKIDFSSIYSHKIYGQWFYFHLPMRYMYTQYK